MNSKEPSAPRFDPILNGFSHSGNSGQNFLILTNPIDQLFKCQLTSPLPLVVNGDADSKGEGQMNLRSDDVTTRIATGRTEKNQLFQVDNDSVNDTILIPSGPGKTKNPNYPTLLRLSLNKVSKHAFYITQLMGSKTLQSSSVEMINSPFMHWLFLLLSHFTLADKMRVDTFFKEFLSTGNSFSSIMGYLRNDYWLGMLMIMGTLRGLESSFGKEEDSILFNTSIDFNVEKETCSIEHLKNPEIRRNMIKFLKEMLRELLREFTQTQILMQKKKFVYAQNNEEIWMKLSNLLTWNSEKIGFAISQESLEELKSSLKKGEKKFDQNRCLDELMEMIIETEIPNSDYFLNLEGVERKLAETINHFLFVAVYNELEMAYKKEKEKLLNQNISPSLKVLAQAERTLVIHYERKSETREKVLEKIIQIWKEEKLIESLNVSEVLELKNGAEKFFQNVVDWLKMKEESKRTKASFSKSQVHSKFSEDPSNLYKDQAWPNSLNSTAMLIESDLDYHEDDKICLTSCFQGQKQEQEMEEEYPSNPDSDLKSLRKIFDICLEKIEKIDLLSFQNKH